MPVSRKRKREKKRDEKTLLGALIVQVENGIFFFFYDFQSVLTLPSRSIISVTTFSSKKMLELVLVPVGIKVQVAQHRDRAWKQNSTRMATMGRGADTGGCQHLALP